MELGPFYAPDHDVTVEQAEIDRQDHGERIDAEPHSADLHASEKAQAIVG
jgi:hypothetical protein